jgi:hypothetical protein
LLELEEPTEDEQAVLRYVEQAGGDVRALLFNLALLRTASRQAATLLFTLSQLPLEPKIRTTIIEILAPLETALATRKGGSDAAQ